MKKCVERSVKDPSINGATYRYTGSPSCYCEKGMTSTTSYNLWKTCFIKRKSNTANGGVLIISYQSMMENNFLKMLGLLARHFTNIVLHRLCFLTNLICNFKTVFSKEQFLWKPFEFILNCKEMLWRNIFCQKLQRLSEIKFTDSELLLIRFI